MVCLGFFELLVAVCKCPFQDPENVQLSFHLAGFQHLQPFLLVQKQPQYENLVIWSHLIFHVDFLYSFFIIFSLFLSDWVISEFSSLRSESLSMPPRPGRVV